MSYIYSALEYCVLSIEELVSLIKTLSVDISTFIFGIVNIDLTLDEVSTLYVLDTNVPSTTLIPFKTLSLPTVIEVWGGCPYYLMGSKVVNDLCTEDPIEIDLTNPTSPGGELINVDFSLTVNCEFARLRPNISAFYDDGCGWKYIGQVVNGHITVPGLETGKGYSFGVWLDDKWFDEFYTIDKTFYTWSIDLPESVCGKY